jgi:hypothetical protein
MWRIRILLAQYNRIQRPPADTWTAARLSVLQLTDNPLGKTSAKKYNHCKSHLKGLSHEKDFKSLDKNLQN